MKDNKVERVRQQVVMLRRQFLQGDTGLFGQSLGVQGIAAVVGGHWSALGLKITPNVIALDTGCLWGGSLTAIRLEDRALFQAHCNISVAKDWGVCVPGQGGFKYQSSTTPLI